MNSERFRFALVNLTSGDWERFEKLAATFIASEYPVLRTTASSSGDQGRDGQLFSPRDTPTIMLQYSVTIDWESKIRATARRVKESFSKAQVLVYVTNQKIGSRSDKVKQEVFQEQSIFLDVRDINWFLERLNRDGQTQGAAEELIIAIADPILSSESVFEGKSNALSNIEAKAALVFLELQRADDSREKGLTKLSYDALVTCALRSTSSTARMTRQAVLDWVTSIVPNQQPESVIRHTNSALGRLSKRTIKHWQKYDEFCLSFEESTRVKNRLAEIDASDSDLMDALSNLVRRRVPDISSDEDLRRISIRVRRLLEVFLLERGEEFVSAVVSSSYRSVGIQELRAVVLNDINTEPLMRIEQLCGSVDFLESIVSEILASPEVVIQEHLRSLADSYTLLAFMKETPDVQSAVQKMFENGQIWMDTSLVLPLFAETLSTDGDGVFTLVTKAAIQAGVRVHVTSGVIEEIVAHMNLCLTFSRSVGQQWDGPVPFLAGRYLETGSSVYGFSSWLETFRGSIRPEDDISEYLREFFSIRRTDLQDLVDGSEERLRYAVQEIWESIHEKRRQQKGGRQDANTASRLAKHDIENYLGVLERRKTERSSGVGFQSWWMVLDRAAFRVERLLRNDHNIPIGVTPLMTPDFLLNYITIGPIRNRVPKETAKMLPTAMDFRLFNQVPSDILSVATSIRERNTGLPEHVIRRKVRDGLDEAKSRQNRALDASSDRLDELEEVFSIGLAGTDVE